MKNKNLHIAKQEKNDEFYTQLIDIEKEMQHYKTKFNNKIVYCNCDSEQSNFWVYFTTNFHSLGLKKVIGTHYTKEHSSYKIEYNGLKIIKTSLKNDGDFRSNECIEILKESDIVVTNPPFSLFREYIDQLIKYEKQFLIIGSMNAITYKDVFALLKNNKVWLGNNYVKLFIQPDKNIKSFGNILWFTNLDHDKRHEFICSGIKYSENLNKYIKYDNYDAINVDKTKEIPDDYNDVMGVPITFLDKYNPKQFDILDIANGCGDFDCKPIKKYINAKQVNLDGTYEHGSKINTRGCIGYENKPEGVYYIADNTNKYIKSIYARILIKRKDLI